MHLKKLPSPRLNIGKFEELWSQSSELKSIVESRKIVDEEYRSRKADRERVMRAVA